MKKFGILLLCLLTIGAASPAAADNTFWGTTMGAALGGYVGSTIGHGSGRLAATGAGVFIGGALGNSFGRSLDRAESYGYGGPGYGSYGWNTPVYNGYEPNYVAPPAPPPPQVIYVEPQIVEYHRVRTPVYVEEGYVGPEPPAPPASSRHCREFTQTIKIDGQVHESYGTACLRPDGTWQIQ